MAAKSNLLLSYHRRFLLRSKLGRSWRAALSTLATQQGLTLHPNSISHVVAGDWSSKEFAFERLISDVLGQPFREVWPEYTRELRHRSRGAGLVVQGGDFQKDDALGRTEVEHGQQGQN